MKYMVTYFKPGENVRPDQLGRTFATVSPGPMTEEAAKQIERKLQEDQKAPGLVLQGIFPLAG